MADEQEKDEKWSWHSDASKEDIVVPQTDAIAIYRNQNGDVVLRQRNDMEEDSFIFIPVKQAKAVADAIKKRARDR